MTIPRIGPVPRRDVRYPLRPGAYAILPRDGSVLLARTDAWLLPGGGLDAGEGPLGALHREVMEETGWRIAWPRKVGAFRRFVWMADYSAWAEKVCSIYVAYPVRRVAEPTEPDHVPVWIPAEAACDLLSVAGERAILRRTLGLHWRVDHHDRAQV